MANFTRVVGAAIASTILLNRAFHTTDVTYTTWARTVGNQISLCLSITTACSAQFKPFLDSLQSSEIRVDALSAISRCGDQLRKYYPRGSQAVSKIISINLRGLGGFRAINYPENHRGPYVETVITANPANSPDWDGASSMSGIIRETRTWEVTEERYGGYAPSSMC